MPTATPPEPEGRITVARLSNPIEAQLARGLLKSEGIECFLIGENVNNLLQAAFRVRMEVRTQVEHAACELLGAWSPRAGGLQS